MYMSVISVGLVDRRGFRDVVLVYNIDEKHSLSPLKKSMDPVKLSKFYKKPLSLKSVFRSSFRKTDFIQFLKNKRRPYQ